MEQTELLHRITSSRRRAAAQLSIDRAQTPDIDRVIGSGMTLYLVCVAVEINFGTTGSGGGQNSSVKDQSSTISNSQMCLSFLKPRFMVPMLRIHRTVTAKGDIQASGEANLRTRQRLGFSRGEMSFALPITSDCDRASSTSF